MLSACPSGKSYVRACMYLHTHTFADRRVRHLCMHSYVIHSFFYSVMCSFSSKMSNFSITHAKSHLLLPFYFLLSPFSFLSQYPSPFHLHAICPYGLEFQRAYVLHESLISRIQFQGDRWFFLNTYVNDCLLIKLLLSTLFNLTYFLLYIIVTYMR